MMGVNIDRPAQSEASMLHNVKLWKASLATKH